MPPIKAYAQIKAYKQSFKRTSSFALMQSKELKTPILCREKVLRVLPIILLAALLVCPAYMHADQAQFFYDALGRLVGVVDGQGNIAAYQYDRVGNLLSITRGTVTAPVITSVSPDPVDAGTTATVTLNGSGLLVASVATTHPEMQVRTLNSSGTTVVTSLTIPNPTTFGSTTLTVTVPGGMASTSLTVRQPTPTITRLNPDTGLAGTTVVVEGTGFGTKAGSNRVTFAGQGGTRVQASIVTESNTGITVRVPSGAIPGPVTVEVGGLTSNGVAGSFDTVGPSVVRVLPFNGQSGVALNTRITLVFDERVNPSTVTSSTFRVVNGGPVAGTIAVASDGLSASLTPAQPLLANEGHSITATAGITDVAGNPLRNAATTTFVTGTGVDTVGPTVVSVSPPTGAQGVPTNALVRIQFPEALFPASVTPQTVLLSAGGISVPVDLTLESNNTEIRLRPANLALLQANTMYGVTVTTGVSDLAGNPLAAAFTSSFTTGVVPDTVAPTVVSVAPPDGATNVPLTTTIVVTFSEPIEPATVDFTTTFTVTGGGVTGTLPGTFSFSADLKAVTFAPAFPLFANQTFFLTLDGIEDVARNRLAPTTTSFTTEAGTAGTVVPAFATVLANPEALFANGQTIGKVTLVNIADGAGFLVPDGTQVAVTAEPAFASNSAGGTVLGGTPSAGDPRFRIFSTVSGKVTFTYQAPSLVLAAGATAPGLIQVASVSAGGAPISLIGTGTVSLVTSTTAAVSVNPTALLANGSSLAELSVVVRDPTPTLFEAIGRPVPAGTPIGVGAINAGGTITGGTVSATPGFKRFAAKTGGRVPTTYQAPTFSAGQTQTEVIQVESLDAAGNFLGFLGNSIISLSGSTGFTAPQPVLEAVSPGDGQSDVGTNALVMARFSQSLNPATVSASTFAVSTGGIPVVGTYALSDSPNGPNTVVTFTLSSALAAGMVFDITMTTGIQSTVGNPLLASTFTTFSTAGGADTTGLIVAQFSPPNGVSGVPHNAPISLLFSEPVNAVTVTSQTFTVSTGGVPISGRVTVRNSGVVNALATFVPDELLQSDTIYTLTVSPTITDTAGNPVPAFTSAFTTTSGAPSIDLAPPSVMTVTPPDGQGNVPLDANVRVQFDEAVNPISVGPGSIGVSAFANVVTGNTTFSADALSLIFTPSPPFPSNRGHTVDVTNGVTDLAGNPLDVSGITTSFFTGSALSNPAGPQVLAVSPADGALDVPLNAAIVIQFAEPVVVTSVTAQTVAVSRGATPLSGTFTFEQNNSVVRWKPTNPTAFAANAAHTVTVTTGLRNLADKPLAAPFTSSFTTGSATDTVAPTLAATSPADGAANVPRTTAIQVTFSEPINPASLLVGTTFFFGSPDVNGTIPGALSVSADHRALTYTPNLPLFANHPYTITVLDVEDVVGNKLGSSGATFTTAVAAGTDLTAVPTAATVDATPNVLLPDGQATATVTISNISRDGIVVPDGTLVAVTAEPAFRLESRGGVIQGGTVSASDSRFKLFSTVGGSVTLTYQAPNIPNLIPGNTVKGVIQVASADAAGVPMRLLGTKTITLGMVIPDRE